MVTVTCTAARYENLLFVGVLATFAVWLTGKVAELRQLHRQYQANTVKTRNVLYTFYLGCRILNKQTTTFLREDFKQAISALRLQF